MQLRKRPQHARRMLLAMRSAQSCDSAILCSSGGSCLCRDFKSALSVICPVQGVWGDQVGRLKLKRLDRDDWCSYVWGLVRQGCHA